LKGSWFQRSFHAFNGLFTGCMETLLSSAKTRAGFNVKKFLVRRI